MMLLPEHASAAPGGFMEGRRMFLLGAGATSGLSDASAPALLSLEAV